MRHSWAVFGSLIASCAIASIKAEELVPYDVVDGVGIPQSLTGGPGNSERGRAVVIHPQQGNCLACHEIPALADEPFHGDVGPSLAGVADRLDEGELRLRVVEPKVVNPDTIMPAFYKTEGLYRVMPKFEGKPILSAEQVEDVVAFLFTLEDEAPALTTARIEAPEQPMTLAAAAGSGWPELISGREFATAATRKLQDDDFSNPASLWLEQGAELWQTADGAAGTSCAECHGDAEDAMKGIGATYPKYHEASGKVINLEQRINLCRSEHMQAEPWPWESPELLAMTAYVKHQSRGMPVDVSIDGPAAPFFEAGEALYYQPRGVMDMACRHCHNDHYGQHLRTNLLTQGQSNGFPMYRLFAQGMMSLHGFVGGVCYPRVRAAAAELGSDDLVNLELYLAWRGGGLPVETPAVRQ
jgi:sulfur-oxidizing protein SoxA